MLKYLAYVTYPLKNLLLSPAKTETSLATSLIISTPVIYLEGEIHSDADGIQKLINFYNEASHYENCDIVVDCYKLKWIDANLSAMLFSFDYLLHKNNNVKIKADFPFLEKQFCFLFENGWLKYDKRVVPDTQQRTLLCTEFSPKNLEGFLEYIKEKLLKHKGTHGLTETLRAQMENDLLEVFGNIDRHAETKDPLFVCGHYYATAGYFVFTLVDLGVGFLSPIERFTNGAINSTAEAINWALSGQSIRNNSEPFSGMGLQGILEYCNLHGGGLQIITGDGFWGTKLPCPGPSGHIALNSPFKGSIINLFFPFKG